MDRATFAFLWAGNFFIHKVMQAITIAAGALLLSDGPDQTAPSEGRFALTVLNAGARFRRTAKWFTDRTSLTRFRVIPTCGVVGAVRALQNAACCRQRNPAASVRNHLLGAEKGSRFTDDVECFRSGIHAGTLDDHRLDSVR